jgi:hypothetical protein
MSNESFKQAYKDAKKELAKLKPRYEQLAKLVESFERLFDLEGKSPDLDITVDPAAFKGLTLKDAALQAMLLIGRPATTRQIADFIEGAGFEHGSKNFWNTVNTTLDRLHKILKLAVRDDSGGWAINEKGRQYLQQVNSEKGESLFKTASTNGS